MAIVPDKSGNNRGVDQHIPSALESMSGAEHQFAVTPSDTVNTQYNFTELRVDAGGTMVVVTNDGSAISYTVADGERLPISGVRVNATGTTATGIVGWY